MMEKRIWRDELPCTQRGQAAQLTDVTDDDVLRILDPMRHLEFLRANLVVESLLSAVRIHTFTFVTGDTGTGKSTRIPLMLLLDDPSANLVICQPTRIAAKRLAGRTAGEFGGLWPHGLGNGKVGDFVGCHIGLEEPCKSAKTQFLYIHYQKIDKYKFVIIDEIHQKDQDTQFVLKMVKDLLSRSVRGREQKFVFMSATAQMGEIRDFVSSPSTACAHVHVRGRRHAIEAACLDTVMSPGSDTRLIDMLAPALVKDLIHRTAVKLEPAEAARLLDPFIVSGGEGFFHKSDPKTVQLCHDVDILHVAKALLEVEHKRLLREVRATDTTKSFIIFVPATPSSTRSRAPSSRGTSSASRP
ncbi:unnamed protein product [Vitrella brassicaformis CCMP3155]|uniref:Helicase ATP-binding domain-containing protein n=1 Tax=Vitrella brassicaformis (strain CCMP3155) TaxID=1169540 RepID=A0A0G4EZ08_VITBC|nr:unnamed protein product [Vitrella brassicaformis CCMP3155]|eukprot:CEM04536.1 unnamed protein product [Vitrella brassicaformis CCMP3155]